MAWNTLHALSARVLTAQRNLYSGKKMSAGNSPPVVNCYRLYCEYFLKSHYSEFFPCSPTVPISYNMCQVLSSFVLIPVLSLKSEQDHQHKEETINDFLHS